jgi:hypothetical protein
MPSQLRLSVAAVALLPALVSGTLPALLPAAHAIPPLPAPRTSASLPDCAWLVKSNTEMANWALPNKATTYWSHAYKLNPGEKLVLVGQFPGNRRQATRFFSFQNYDVYGVTVATLFDARIQPLQPGQTNPYTPRGSRNPQYGRYQVEVIHGPTDPAQPNQMRAYPEGLDPTAPVPYGVLMLRYYLPPDQDQNADRFGPGIGEAAGAGGQGGVPLPAIYRVGADQQWRRVPPCPAAVRKQYSKSADPGRLALPLLFFQELGPVFVRPAQTQGVYPNDANAYLSAQANYRPGQGLLLQGRVPRTPNTLAGEAPGSPRQQIRYWSICVNENAYPIPVTTPNGCLDDQQVLHAPGRQGDAFQALVVRNSDFEQAFTPAERAALRRAGLFVLDWYTEDPADLAATPTSSPITLLMRNVPSGRLRDLFPHQAANVPPGSVPAVAQKVMGPYSVDIQQRPLRELLPLLLRGPSARGATDESRLLPQAPDHPRSTH